MSQCDQKTITCNIFQYLTDTQKLDVSYWNPSVEKGIILSNKLKTCNKKYKCKAKRVKGVRCKKYAEIK